MTKCELGKDCDLTIAYMKGHADGTEAALKKITASHVLLPLEATEQLIEVIAKEANCCGGIADTIYRAIVSEAGKNSQRI